MTTISDRFTSGIPDRLYGPTNLPGASTSLIIVPGSERLIVTHLQIVNRHATIAGRLQLTLNGAVNFLFDSLIANDSTEPLPVYWVLRQSDEVFGLQSGGATIHLTIFGYRRSLGS